MSELRQEIERALASHREWAAAPYDGVLGTPPSWVPDEIQQKFREIRNRLLCSWSADEVLDFMHGTEELTGVTAEGTWTSFVFPELYPDVDFLCLLRKAAKLGMSEGLRLLIGSDAVRGRRVRDAAIEGGVSRSERYPSPAELQAQASKIWASKQDLSVYRVAQMLAAQGLGNVERIRKKIHRP